MLKSFCIFLIAFLFIILSGCQKDTSPISINPEWLNAYIEDIKNDPAYFGTVITRYEWKDKYYFDVSVPSSSCYMCEVYNQYGELMVWNESSAIEFTNNRRNGIIVWRWQETK